MLKVKICGLTSVGDALMAAEAGADYLGLIFAKSPRKVDTKTAHEILWNLPKGVEAVGVFQNQPIEEVRQILDATGLKIAQLHGQESPRFCKELGVQVIKTFDQFSEGALEDLKKYDAFAFLLDAPKGAGARSQIDPEWAILAKRYGRILVAGKLAPHNVGELVVRIRPYGVDSASGTEKSPGVKDLAKVRDFIQAAREAHQETTRIKVKTKTR
jgi:phosphoribosylanthranilate isomerase